MSERYTVEGYNSRMDCHICKDDKGKKHFIDLMVNGDFPQYTAPIDIIGKTVVCLYTYSYMSLAVNVEVENDTDAKDK